MSRAPSSRFARLAVATAVATLQVSASFSALAAEAASAPPPANAPAPAQAANAPTTWPDIDGVWFTDAPASFRKPDNFLRAPYDQIFAETRRAISEGRPAGDATTDCLPAGMPRVMLAPYPMEIRATNQQVTILFEYMQQVLRVHMDGRDLPDEPDPGYMGYAVGHWEGDTLVVRLIGRNGITQLDGALTPHSDKLTLELRLQRKGDELTVTTTATDPEAYNVPLTSVKVFELRNDIEIMEYNCSENNRNPSDSDGNTLFIMRNESADPIQN